MLSNSIRVYLEIVHTVLQYPAEISVHLRRIPGLRIYLSLTIGLTALSSSTGLYLVRDYYADGALFAILMQTVLLFAALMLWGVVCGALVDALVRLKYPQRSGRTWEMVSVALFAFIPFFFTLPLAWLVRFTATRLQLSPTLFMFAGLALFFFWYTFNAVRGLQYLYELIFGDALAVYLKTIFIMLIFPLLLLLIFTGGILQLLT